MNEVSDSDFDALAQEFYSDPTPESLQIFGPQLCECLGLDLSRRSLSVIASWDWHLRTCLSNSRGYAVSYLQTIGVVKCDWESISLRDETKVITMAAGYLSGLFQSDATLQRELGSELLTHLESQDVDSTDLIIKAGYLRLLTPQFYPTPTSSWMPVFDIRRFLALNRPWLHLKDDWDTHRIAKPDDLFAELARATDHDQAIKALLTHSFPLHESFNWAGPEKASLSLADVSAAFKTKFLDPWKNVERLAHFVTVQCDRYYDAKTAFMSPYTSIVQSSACGKTRLLIEYANGVPCVYFCLGDMKSRCFPRPTRSVSADLTVSVVESERPRAVATMKQFLLAVMAASFVKANELGWDTKQFIACQSIGTEAPNQLEHMLPTYKLLSREDALKKVTEAAPTVKGSPTMVLILDEASGLLSDQAGYISAFRIFRRAWAELAKELYLEGIKIFALLTDTTSRVANFSPSTGRDSSYRNLLRKEDQPEPQRLLKPYFMVVNMDVFVEANHPTTLDQAFDIKTIARKGRPVWHATVQSSPEDGISNAIDLAIRKVCSGLEPDQLKENEKVRDSLFIIAVASLGMRVVLEVHSYGSLAETLSSSSMRFVTGISDSRDAVLTEYPSDPLLSHAASIVTSESVELRPAEILRHLLGTLQHKLVSAGNIGEMVQQYIYTLARDSVVFGLEKTSGARLEYPTFSVSDFIKSLHSQSLSNISGTVQDKEAVLQGRMSFSHFIQLEYTPNKRDLLNLFIRGAAACCKAGQAGVDLIIPILMERSALRATKYPGVKAGRGVYANCDALMSADYSQLVGGLVKTGKVTLKDHKFSSELRTVGLSRSERVADTTGDITEANISFLLCQVKNRVDPDENDDAKLTPVYCGVVESGEVTKQPYLAIRHELRTLSKTDATIETMKEETGRVGVVMYRMDSSTSPCLNYRREKLDTPTEDLLEQVLTTSVQCLKMTDEYPDRLVLAIGALPCQIKLSQALLDGSAVKPQPKPSAKKRKTVG